MIVPTITTEEIALYIQNVWFKLSDPGDTETLKQIFELQMQLYSKYKILPSAIKTLFEEEREKGYPKCEKDLLNRLFNLENHLQSIYAEQYGN
ncbi:hypothetical protein ACQKNX_23040 [Lysinibacillus sp. NPDC093712]|uniref:hypothetical protein n=1 Tax=Lysinibacillus sp. NPDC093712 TaxID=3390579 RepID=UPI003D04F0A7